MSKGSPSTRQRCGRGSGIWRIRTLGVEWLGEIVAVIVKVLGG